MDLYERAVDVLRRAESEIRLLVSEAASIGDYSSVERLVLFARTIASLPTTAPPRAREADTQTAERARANGTATQSAPRRSTVLQKSSQSVYPRFYKDENRVVRVSWSKRLRKEYEHKAPYLVLMALVDSIVRKADDGRIFSTDELLPLYDESGSVTPNYQAYVAIALLRQAGLVDVHGRQGYSVSRPAELSNAVESIWSGLPSKSS